MDQRFTEPAVPEPIRSFGRQRLVAVGIALCVFAALGTVITQIGVTGGAPAPTVIAVKANAVAVHIDTGQRSPTRIGQVTPIAGEQESDATAKAVYSYPADGSLVRAKRLWVGARSLSATASSMARADIGELELFGGRIRLADASLVATTNSGRRAEGAFTAPKSMRLFVDGHSSGVPVNKVIALKGLGTVTVNEQAVIAASPRGDDQTGPRYALAGAIAHIRLAQPYRNLPAGTEIVIGRVESSVRNGAVRGVKHPGVRAAVPPAVPSGVAGVSLQRGAPAPGESSLPRRAIDVRASASRGAALDRYLFPILGHASYSNDWGAARASTGMGHQGTDIFAAAGTPIVATADGVLDRVGWNSIGGYRFWLFDRQGTAFYHAHLSAFSPLAQDGAWVKAGDVIGFVGNTGDAATTPPHLHFEIHPGNGAATNPFPYLNAWKRGIATVLDVLGGSGDGYAPLALLSSADIAPNSGLQSSVLGRVVDTARPVSEETKPKPTDETLSAALDGAGITGR